MRDKICLSIQVNNLTTATLAARRAASVAVVFWMDGTPDGESKREWPERPFTLTLAVGG